MCLWYLCGLRYTVCYYSLCMGRPTWVPLMGVVHVCDPGAEEEPEAVKGEECAAQHGDGYAAFVSGQTADV